MSTNTTPTPYGAVRGRVDAYRGYIDLYAVEDALHLGPDKSTVVVGVDGVYFRAYVDAYRTRLTPVSVVGRAKMENSTALLRGLGDLEFVAITPGRYVQAGATHTTIDTKVVPVHKAA